MLQTFTKDESGHDVSIDAVCCLGHEDTAQQCFLHCIHGGDEEWAQLGIRHMPGRPGADSDGIITAAMTVAGANSAHREDCAFCDAIELTGMERSIGSDDDHAAALVDILCGSQVLPTLNCERATEVALQQCANGKWSSGRLVRIIVVRCMDCARTRADTRLKTERARARSGTDTPVLYRPLGGGVQSAEHMLLGNRPCPDITQVTIVRLTHDWIDRGCFLMSGLMQHPADKGIRHFERTQRTGEEDRRFDLAKFLHLRDADEFAVTISGENRRRNGDPIGHDGRDPGVKAWLLADGGVTYPDTRHIGNGVVGPGWEFPDKDVVFTDP